MLTYFLKPSSPAGRGGHGPGCQTLRRVVREFVRTTSASSPLAPRAPRPPRHRRSCRCACKELCASVDFSLVCSLSCITAQMVVWGSAHLHVRHHAVTTGVTTPPL
jgi:hypothetical protein